MTAPTSPASPASDLYGDPLLAHAPRVLGMMDREALSPTSGCCDRTYWAWKFVDMPAPRFQEALCFLSYLYATPLGDGRYTGRAKMLEWIEAGLRYWCGLQHRDGSFDEAYPFERSLAATAFSSFYVAEALGFLDSHVSPTTRQQVLETLDRAARWLVRNDETHGVLSNHLAAAAAASHHAYRLLDRQAYADRSAHFCGRIISRQSSEGWYEEYGGPDPGYQTHGSFYLVRLWQLNGDEVLAGSLRRAMRFLAECVHPDGSIGGEYASRDTKTYYPAAFEMFAPHDDAAAWIASVMRPSVSSGTAAGLHGVDAHNYFPFLNNFAFAHGAAADPPLPAPKLPPPLPEFRWFPEAGLAIRRTPSYTAYVGTSKGGVVHVYDTHGRSPMRSDCGYVGRTHRGKLVSTQYLDPTRPVTAGEGKVEVRGAVALVSRPTMAPFRFLGFRVFSLTVGRWAPVGRWLKRLLVRLLIYRRTTMRIAFRRVVTFTNDGVTVHDELIGPDGAALDGLHGSDVFTSIHMGSARYFVPSELGGREPAPADAIPGAEIVSGVTRSRHLSLG